MIHPDVKTQYQQQPQAQPRQEPWAVPPTTDLERLQKRLYDEGQAYDAVAIAQQYRQQQQTTEERPRHMVQDTGDTFVCSTCRQLGRIEVAGTPGIELGAQSRVQVNPYLMTCGRHKWYLKLSNQGAGVVAEVVFA